MKAWIVKVYGSDYGFLLVTPKRSSEYQNLWVDDHPSTYDEKEVNILTDAELETEVERRLQEKCLNKGYLIDQKIETANQWITKEREEQIAREYYEAGQQNVTYKERVLWVLPFEDYQQSKKKESDI